MGCGNIAQKLLLLKNNAQSIEINTQINAHDKKESEKNIITLDYFFTIIQNNCLDENIRLDRISTLNLSFCQLTDLPLSIINLNLRCLTLSHNEFSNVPICLNRGLENLECLDISHNLIKDFDIELACLACLKIVKINNNLLTVLPKWVTSFQSVNLEELNFSYNKATNYYYLKNSKQKNMIKLNKLKLKNSQLRDTDFDFLKCFQHLEYLDISNKGSEFINRIHDADNLFVNLKWKYLKILKMNDLSISLFPEGITWIETLTELHINKNCISWLPTGIEYMVNLQIIDISENTLIAIPDNITKLEYLEVILAYANKIEICPDFSKMESLRILDLYDNLLECISLNCCRIEKVDIENNYFDANELSNYTVKKEKLRLHYQKIVDRIDGQKLKQCNEELSEASTDEENEDNILFDSTIVTTIIDEDEDWDAPVVKTRNPEIDSADEEWIGYEQIVLEPSQKVEKKVYVQDEDWMFEDLIEM